MAEKQPVKTQLTRKEMEAVIADGGSILHDGQVHTSAATLPDEIDLATTDEEKAAAAAAVDEEEKAVAAKKEKIAAKNEPAAKKK